jgi:diaminopimelate epimerase
MKRFEKYEGLGNDFLVIDAEEWPEETINPARAVALCDRHRGVGGDGVLWVRHSRDSARMVIYNADGTRPEMCGNGVRCVAAWLADHGALRETESIVIESDAGMRRAIIRGRDATQWLVEVDMGVAAVTRSVAQVGDTAVHAVDMGNPHGVLFEPQGNEMEIVRAVTALPAFPKGVNVEFVRKEADGFRVRVHERGVGWTQACGTGACAVAAAAVHEGLVSKGVSVRVTLDGGTLTLDVDPTSFNVRMTGPARRAFAGSV